MIIKKKLDVFFQTNLLMYLNFFFNFTFLIGTCFVNSKGLNFWPFYLANIYLGWLVWKYYMERIREHNDLILKILYIFMLKSNCFCIKIIFYF
jgi:hypothetical protein